MTEVARSVEIDLPFRYDEQGNVAVAHFRGEQALNRLSSLADTSPGERVMRPEYGTIARSRVFENFSPQLANEIAESLRDQVREYDPDIQVNSVNAIEEVMSAGGAMAFEVSYSVPDYEGGTTMHRATIEVGGAITEESYGG